MNEISKWLNEGAGIQEGIRLLSIYAPNPRITRLAKANPKIFGHLLIDALTPFAAADQKTAPVPTRQFRKDWPFLAEPTCPPELKILAADKITAYNTYVSEHRKLSSCTSLQQCFDCAKKIIENYKENRKILSEFTYYKEHRKILGEHPIFEEMKRLSDLRSLPITKLLKKKKNLEDNIWRIQSEIRKNDKPHLLESRQSRLRTRQLELAEVNRLILDFDNRK